MSNKKDLIICRCEEVTEEEIRQTIRDGADNIDAIKRITRAGMGLCQGITCRKLVARIIHEETRKPLGKIIPATFRAPLRVIPTKVLGRSEKNNNY